ncbi:FAD-dependent oxidoreductase [Candidatus Saccharibacteria bacterium]|nr:FAD-dependent oxidoreductase [Candidatus Saccharibacteria bacterium]
MKKEIDIVVVGAGMAGMTAAIYAKRAGREVLVLEKKAFGGQIIDSLRLDNWPGEPGVSGPDLMEKIYHQANNLGVNFKDEEVISIASKEGDKGFVVKTNENEYSCGAIILAMGTEPRKLGEKQTKEAGKRPISYCATCDGALYKGRPVVVVGSGNTAKYEIKYLEKIASKVYHVHHDDVLPEDAEAIFVAIGRVPSTGFLQGLVELDQEGYIVADETCVTSCPGVFVAGDCRTKNLRQLVTAAGDGANAAMAAVQYLE